jgi:hypothetical protein
MDFLDTILLNTRLSDQSKRLYKNNLIKLNNNKSIDNFDFLKDKYKIIELIEEYKLNTQRNYIISIMSVLKYNSEYNDLYKEYYDLYYIINDNIKQQNKNN